MEQRSLRLGDIVDDYCPRERRITNHVVVALAGEIIQQTRCATCESDHEYKEARVPKKKMKSDADATSPLAGGVLVAARSATEAPAVPVNDVAPVSPVNTVNTVHPVNPVNNEVPAAPVNGNVAAASGDTAIEMADTVAESSSQDEPVGDGWQAHRPLIRATLPRVEGEQPVPRVIPEFTMHQRPGRGFVGRGFRPSEGSGGPGQGRDGNGPNGNRPPQGGGGGRNRRRRRR